MDTNAIFSKQNSISFTAPPYDNGNRFKTTGPIHLVLNAYNNFENGLVPDTGSTLGLFALAIPLLLAAKLLQKTEA